MLLHPAGSSINYAIYEEISKFSPNVSQWEDYFSCSFLVEYIHKYQSHLKFNPYLAHVAWMSNYLLLIVYIY